MPEDARSNTRVVVRPGFALAVGATAAAALLTHARSLGAPFFADDWLFLDQARFRSLPQVLSSPDPLGNYFRPLGRQVWFWLLARASGESPVAFHAANLLCLIASVILLAVLVRKLAGELAGVVAASFLAVHYAADVPVLWVSGSQELLSLALALAALLIYVRGPRSAAQAWTAALAYFLSLLAKEVVVLLPVVAMALDGAGGERPPWRARVRRAWPLGTAFLAWVALAGFAMARRGTGAAGVSLSPEGAIAAPLLLARVALGLEWETGAWVWAHPTDPGFASLLAVLVASLAVLAMAPAAAPRPASAPARGKARARAPVSMPAGAPRTSPTSDTAPALRAGVVWAVAGALPVAVVAPNWSAYYFLFALAGVALILGALAASRPRLGALAAFVVAVAGIASSQARGLDEFATAPSPWSGQSHVNRFYLERGMRVIARGVEDLRSQIPRPAKRTTFFFAGLPPFASFQVADGPLVRGVYRDSTLRGYYLSQLSHARLERGPWVVFFFDNESGHLEDKTATPGVLLSSAMGQVLNGRLDVAEAALEAASAHGENDFGVRYVAAWVAWAQGDSARAKHVFEEIGDAIGRDAGPALARARVQLAGRDTAGATLTLRRAVHESMLDPSAHATIADLLLARPESVPEGELEAFATRALTPASPAPWRRWAIILAKENRQRESIDALDRYFQLAPPAASQDTFAVRLRALLVRMLPGGDIVQRDLRKEIER